MVTFVLSLYIIIAIIIAIKFRNNYFHPIPFIYLFWLITFPFKYSLYNLEEFAPFIVFGHIGQQSVLDDALLYSFLYIAITLFAFWVFSLGSRNKKFPLTIGNMPISSIQAIWVLSGIIFIGFNMNLIVAGNLSAFLSDRNVTYAGNGFFKVFGG